MVFLPAVNSNIQAIIATEKDQPNQLCCHLGIQLRSLPWTPNVNTVINMKNALKIEILKT